MGLKDTIANAVVAARAAAGDIPVPVDYVSVATGAYDPATNARVETLTTVTINVFNVGLTQSEVEYFPADRDAQKLIVVGTDLTFIPKVTDRVLIGGVRWEVKRVKRVPGDSIYIVFIQEP